MKKNLKEIKLKKIKEEIKKQIIVTIIMFVVIALVAVLYQNLKTTPEEKIATNMVHSYQQKLKDPDSLILRSDVVSVYVFDDDLGTLYYSFFVASGNNSFGASIQSVVCYESCSFLTSDLESIDIRNSNDFESYEEYLRIAKAKLAYVKYNIYCLTGEKPENYGAFEVVKKEKIAKKLNIEYQKIDWEWNTAHISNIINRLLFQFVNHPHI